MVGLGQVSVVDIPSFTLAWRGKAAIIPAAMKRGARAPHQKPAAIARLAALVPAAFIAIGTSHAATQSSQSVQFLSFDNLRSFKRSKSEKETIFLSPVIRARIAFNELIASWNAKLPDAATLEIQARIIYRQTNGTPEIATKFYRLGIWSGNRKSGPRESVLDQRDSFGDVSTDTLKLINPTQRLQLKIILTGKDSAQAKVSFIGICLTDTNQESETLSPNTNAWNKLIDVPERSQMKYDNGSVLCSPTSLSMLLAYWAGKLHQPALDHDVPEVAGEVFDPNWDGTGNWPFNTAYAGSLDPLRGYVTRLSMTELENWIDQGIPVALSVCYNRLRGRAGRYSGHLVVCVGFTRDGDPIINDPGTSRNVRKIFARENLIKAWAYSKNTVYLVYPKKIKPPRDPDGHWDSATSRRFETDSSQVRR